MKKSESYASGLSQRDIETISLILAGYPVIAEVHIFGSRAKGTYKNGSDIDLAVMNGGVSEQIIRSIKARFEDSSLAYMVDLVNFPVLDQADLKEHIVRVGKTFYIKR